MVTTYTRIAFLQIRRYAFVVYHTCKYMTSICHRVATTNVVCRCQHVKYFNGVSSQEESVSWACSARTFCWLSKWGSKDQLHVLINRTPQWKSLSLRSTELRQSRSTELLCNGTDYKIFKGKLMFLSKSYITMPIPSSLDIMSCAGSWIGLQLFVIKMWDLILVLISRTVDDSWYIRSNLQSLSIITSQRRNHESRISARVWQSGLPQGD